MPVSPLNSNAQTQIPNGQIPNGQSRFMDIVVTSEENWTFTQYQRILVKMQVIV
jgi:hypothetical protein